jgi:hypothetical protein
MTRQNSSSPAAPAPTDADIRERAYYLWLDQGCPPNRDQEMWFAAKTLLHDQANHQREQLQHQLEELQAQRQFRLHADRTARDARPEVARSGAAQRQRSRAVQN